MAQAAFDLLRRKAAAIVIDPNKPSRDESFRNLFNLPSDQTIASEIQAEFSLSNSATSNRTRWDGRLVLSSTFLCFSADKQKSCHFAIPLQTIQRVERLNSNSAVFVLSITLWNDIRLRLALEGLRQHAETFSDKFKTNLRAQVHKRKSIKAFIKDYYSEYQCSAQSSEQKPTQCGLGQKYGYPGDAKKLRDGSKMRLWGEYFRDHGRNLTLVRYPTFPKLVRIGLPNRLRGELWELISGSMYQRWIHAGEYDQLLAEKKGETSVSLEEIEKDLYRSLPEYPAYQNEEGINALRRVLATYSWKNPEVGYCQAMNIVIAAILIFTTEEQAFWILSTLCEHMIPGYYSTTMYGTLLDQKVFEELVKKTLPALWDHFTRNDMQLSIVSLPWFLSLYVNSMPLIFAFRVLDCLFLEGPKVLFQVGLAILRINGEELLDITDDGSFIQVLKDYFSRLDESAHPKSSQPKTRAITKFQVLMSVALREFNVITTGQIEELRRKHKESVLNNIELFAKRTQVRNIKGAGKLTAADIDIIYDRYYAALHHKRLGYGKTETQMEYESFKIFMAGIASWARDEEIITDAAGERRTVSKSDDPAEHPFLHRLFSRFDKSLSGTLSLQNVAIGVAEMARSDLMYTISYFFDMHDSDGDGVITKEEILELSESLLFITRNFIELGEGYLSSISRLIRNCFSYGEKESQETLIDEPSLLNNAALDPSTKISLNLPTFRMVILADELLEAFFTLGFSDSINLTSVPTELSSRGLRGLFDNLVSDGLRVAEQVRKRVEEQPPSSKESQGTNKPSNAQEDDEGQMHEAPKEDDRDLLMDDMDEKSASSPSRNNTTQGADSTGPITANENDGDAPEDSPSGPSTLLHQVE